MILFLIFFSFRYAEAEDVLTDYNCIQNNNFDDFVSDYGDQAAFALLLLAKIAAKTERQTRAIEAFSRALKLNPFLWSTFKYLCNMGEKPNPNIYFQLTDLENLLLCHGNSINLVESLVFSNSTPSGDNPVYLTTPQQVLSNSRPSIYSSICTPEENPLVKPLCLSGIGLLPNSKLKAVRCRMFDISPGVSTNFMIYVCM